MARDMMDSSWRDQFTVTHAAMGAVDGTAYFPIIPPGVESRGLCAKGAEKKNCEPITMYTVDTYVNEIVHPKVMEAAAAAASLSSSSSSLLRGQPPLQEEKWAVDAGSSSAYPPTGAMIDVLSVTSRDLIGMFWD